MAWFGRIGYGYYKMFLTTRVISDSGQTLTEPAKTFGEDGGTIGRSPEADWVLPDSSGFLSRLHARVFFAAGAFYIEDVSINGIYRIDASEHVRISSPARLRDGDLLELGDFKVRVEISETPDFPVNNTGDFSWGFSKLRLDESLLAAGAIAIPEAHGEFPDGTRFKIPENDDPPEPLHIPGDTRNSTVYLAIEEPESDTKNRLQLLIGTEGKDNGPHLGVARVIELRNDNTVVLDDKYIPTVINCQAAPHLLGLAKEILGLLHTHGESIAGRLAAAVGLRSADLADFLMLQLINRYESLLGHLISLQVIHPEALYRLAIEIVGELSTFGTERKRPRPLPAYRHHNLQISFRPVMEELRKSLSKVYGPGAISIRVVSSKYGILAASFPKDLLNANRLVLAIKGHPPAAVLIQRVPDHITIGPPDQIAQLIRAKQPGVPIRSLAVTPRQIPHHSGYAYFEIDQHSRWFTAIKEFGALALHFGADFGDMDVQLWAIRSEGTDEPERQDVSSSPFHADPLPEATRMPESIVQSAPGELEESHPPDYDGSKPITDLDKTASDSAHSAEEVQFTVYRPTAIKPLAWYTLLAFAHRSTLPADATTYQRHPLAEVEQQASKILGSLTPQYQTVTQDSNFPVFQAMEITFVPEVPGVEFNPSRRSFFWEETVHREEFRLRADAAMDGKVARGRITVFLGSIILADVSLNIRVHKSASLRQERSEFSTDRSSAYKKIFASYSHKDTGIVKQFVHYAKALGDEYFMDLTHLRAGERWSERLQHMIRDANIFQLFWSSNSMRSPYVKREWEYALSLHRPGFIRPTYWEEPLPCSSTENLPPEELLQIHFQQINFKHAPQGCPMAVDSGSSEQQWTDDSIDHQESARSKRLISPLIGIALALVFAFVVWAIMKW